MNKRLLKRHKRQVLRAKERVRVSEPDLRTPEQVKAAREASRSVVGLSHDPHAHYSTPPPIRNHAGHAAETSTAEGEGGS
jgi:hypothetical protein